jgi:hypothetical protein
LGVSVLKKEMISLVKNYRTEGCITKNPNLRTLSTSEIQKLLNDANMDFETIVNKALNDYLPKIFLCCPFTDELCIHKKQCVGCDSYELNKTC